MFAANVDASFNNKTKNHSQALPYRLPVGGESHAPRPKWPNQCRVSRRTVSERTPGAPVRFAGIYASVQGVLFGKRTVKHGLPLARWLPKHYLSNLTLRRSNRE